MKHAVISSMLKNALLKAVLLSSLMSFMGSFVQGQDMTLDEVRQYMQENAFMGGPAVPPPVAEFGENWFSNVNPYGRIGVWGYCFPKNQTHKTLNRNVDKAIRRRVAGLALGQEEAQLIQIRFSGGRFYYYVDAASLMKYRLQSVENAIHELSTKVQGLLRAFDERGIDAYSLVVLLLKNIQGQLGAYASELEEVRGGSLVAGQALFERFCNLYRNTLYPFIQWVDAENFDPDHFHDAFWTVNIVDAVHPDVVRDPGQYPEGPDAWRVLNERIQATLHGQYFDAPEYALAQWELYSLRVYFLILELQEAQDPRNAELITFLEQTLDEELNFGVYFNEGIWGQPNEAVLAANDVFDTYVEEDEYIEEEDDDFHGDGLYLSPQQQNFAAAFIALLYCLSAISF